MALEKQQVLQGRYRVVRNIKSGGMGAVYEAIDSKLADTPCAIKEVLPSALKSADAEYILQSFDKEMRALASLEHPHIPRVRDYFEQNGSRYIVLDLVRGKPLDEELREHLQLTGKAMEAAVAAADMVTVLETLQYLHTRRPPIIHRDVKPANLIRDDSGKIKLVDFGIAKTLGTELMQTQVGTPGYCAPEQMSGRAEARSDIYSVGATLYALCAGAPPAGYCFDDIDTHFSEHPQLREIILKATALKASDRYASAEEMAQALRAWLKDEPLPLPPPSEPGTGSDSSKVSAVPTRPMPPEIQPSQDRMLYLTALLLIVILGSFLIWVVRQNVSHSSNQGQGLAQSSGETAASASPKPIGLLLEPRPSPANTPKTGKTGKTGSLSPSPGQAPHRAISLPHRARPVRQPRLAVPRPRLETPEYPTSVPRPPVQRRLQIRQPENPPATEDAPRPESTPDAPEPRPTAASPPPSNDVEGFRRLGATDSNGGLFRWFDGSYKIEVRTAHFPGRAKFEIRERTSSQWPQDQSNDWRSRSGGTYLEASSGTHEYRAWHIENGVMYTIVITPKPEEIKRFYAILDRFIDAYPRSQSP